MQVQIRDAKPEDLREIIEIEHENFSNPWTAQMFIEALHSPQRLFRVAVFPPDKVVGYYVLLIIAPEAHLENISVSRMYWRKGIGSRMLEDLIEAAYRRQAKEIYLEVRPSNSPALALYRKFGFDVVYKRPNYYTNPREDALVLLKILRAGN